MPKNGNNHIEDEATAQPKQSAKARKAQGQIIKRGKDTFRSATTILLPSEY